MALRDKQVHPLAGFARRFIRPNRIPDGPITPVVISRGTTATKFQVGSFLYALGGHIYYKAAQDEIVFTAVHATGIAKWLGVLLMIDREGTVTTKSNPDTGDQDHASEAAALASLVAGSLAGLDPPGKVRLGSITLLTNAADWDANANDLNDADLLAVNYNGESGDRRWAQFNPAHKFRVISVRPSARSKAGIAHIEVITTKNGVSGVLSHPRLEVDARAIAAATNVKFRVGNFLYTINGAVYVKSAATAIVFSAAHVVSLDKWGAILVQINATGTVSTKVGEATPTTPMAYTNQAAARAALPAPDAGNVEVGVIIIEAGAAAWDANTDDLIAASDLENLDVLPATTARLLSGAGLALDTGEKEDFKVIEFTYVIDGVKYTKAAASGIDFTVAHVCAANKFLAILVMVNSAGTISTKVPVVDGRSQTASQGFNTANLAIAALPSTTPGTVAIGYILIENNAGAWTANTDDMDAGVDVTSATFHSYDAATNDKFAVEGAVFGTNALDAVTVASGASKAAAIGDEDGQVVVLVGGTTGIIGTPEIDVEVRPYPVSGGA